MNKKSAFKNSGLDRATPKTHRFHSFINKNLKKHRSDIGLVEDRTPGTTVVRIIMGLLLLHVVVIGGVLVRGHLVKTGAGVAISPTVTPPPAANAAADVEKPGEVLTKPTAAPAQPANAANTPLNLAVTPTANPDAHVGIGAPKPADTHITQAPAAGLDDTAEEVEPAAPVAATTTPAQPAAHATVTVKHLINSGENWTTISKQYGVTVAALKAANPKAAAKNMLYQGTYLDVPVAADSERGKAVAAQQQQEAAIAAGTTHTIQKGESLGRIAKKYKTSVNKLMQLNGFEEKDLKRLKPGQTIKVAE